MGDGGHHQYATPALSANAISALLYNAGIMCGIGDNRQEKGKGSYGTFEPTGDLPESLCDAGRQLAARTPQPANLETKELLAEFDAEVESRI